MFWKNKTKKTLRERAESIVYLTEGNYKRPNPEAFGAGGYECYDPENLVNLIIEQLKEIQKEKNES